MRDKLALLRKRKYTIVIVLALIGVICRCVVGMLNNEDNKRPMKVSVIAEDINDSRWTPFRLGINQAAKDYNINVSYITSGKFAGPEDEKLLIEQEIRENISGLILSPYADEEMAEIMKELPAGLQVVLVESDISRENNVPEEVKAVVPDYEKIGERLAQELLKDNHESLNSKNIMIFMSNSQTKAIREVVDAFQKNIEEYDGKVFLKLKDNHSDDSADEIFKNSRADIVVAMDDKSLKKAARYLEGAGRKDIDLYGIGCSETSVYYLDKNIIKSMVVPNEFTMGYQSLALIAQKKEENKGDSEETVVGYQVVRPEEIYDSANEKLLFPIVQ